MSVVLLGSTSGSITLQEPAVAGTNTVNFGANTGVAILDANTPAFRNRILNGGMVIDQRNAGASVTPSAGFNTYTLDRWNATYSVGSKFSVEQTKQIRIRHILYYIYNAKQYLPFSFSLNFTFLYRCRKTKCR